MLRTTCTTYMNKEDTHKDKSFSQERDRDE